MNDDEIKAGVHCWCREKAAAFYKAGLSSPNLGIIPSALPAATESRAPARFRWASRALQGFIAPWESLGLVARSALLLVAGLVGFYGSVGLEQPIRGWYSAR
ncbi:hypothetical protein ElyMa_003191500 [Elysia marginata]|uniref:Uncharacterized protein n=1 Tax=Elysia marginata TaxID=1093978 RepID=A0AAV4J0U1_9GAST|nr:hypothetical protein ElyMa_003191500 [Elysia marginata]